MHLCETTNITALKNLIPWAVLISLTDLFSEISFLVFLASENAENQGPEIVILMIYSFSNFVI